MVTTIAMPTTLQESIAQNSISWKPIDTLGEPRHTLATEMDPTTTSVTEVAMQ